MPDRFGFPVPWLAVAGVLAAALAGRPGALWACVARPASRPSFVFLISDDHRWDCLGAAGNDRVRTPALDRLAREGVYFRQATIHIPQCSPSRSTLLTGLPPHQHGHYSNQHQTPEAQQRDGFSRFPLLPGRLREAGYRTVLVGKWHPHPDPWNCGFSDVRLWMPGGGGPYEGAALARGPARQTVATPGFTNALFADDAAAFLRSEEARTRPFFLWVAFTAPHLPMSPVPEEARAPYAGKAAAELEPPGFAPGTPARGGNWPDYYASITHLDQGIGRILAALDETRQAENTVVAFLGDNGYMMGSRGRSGKVVPYEESVRVPMILRAPEMTGKGPSEAPVSSLDLPPTFLRLAGLNPPDAWVGRDLTPLLGDPAADTVREAFCEWADNQSAQFGKLGYRVVRTPRHKLIRWEQPDLPDELYDLQADPHEGKNLADDPAAAAVKTDLLARLRAWMEKTDDPARAWK